LSQTYSNIEVILVDDGSTDDTLAVCQQLALTDERIVVISKTNGGLGSARNAGLDAATGDYVWFYDVDDDADVNLVERNVGLMEKYGVDLIIFSFLAVTPHLNLEDRVQFKQRLISNNVTLKSIYVEELLLVKHGNGFAWNKFYLKSFIDRYTLRFGNQRIQQDELFNLKLYPLLNKVYISPDVLYRYYIYDKGVTRCRYISNRFEIYSDVFRGFMTLAEEWGLNNDRFVDYVYHRFYSGIENVILFNTFHSDSGLSLSEKRSVVYNILNDCKTKQCLTYISGHNNFNIEQSMYLKAFCRSSFASILCLRNLFLLLRKVKGYCKLYKCLI
jgi:glycosyltransferase involved in cell wall biosynthesis